MPGLNAARKKLFFFLVVVIVVGKGERRGAFVGFALSSKPL